MTTRELVEKLRELEKACEPGECNCGQPVRSNSDPTLRWCHFHCPSVRYEEKRRRDEAVIAAAPSLLPLVAALLAEVEAWRDVRGITDQRAHDEDQYAAAGQTFSVDDLRSAVDAAVLCAIATDAAAAKCGEGI